MHSLKKNTSSAEKKALRKSDFQDFFGISVFGHL
jgi:hypothetical protein